jgi:hypothetical protein
VEIREDEWILYRRSGTQSGSAATWVDTLVYRYVCGFGACLSVELALPSTRWMSGAARTLHTSTSFDMDLLLKC